tara:strand:+ start:151 stop:327 length:177 start_codon:yes stop_codon:yes gene_type:complete
LYVASDVKEIGMRESTAYGIQNDLHKYFLNLVVVFTFDDLEVDDDDDVVVNLLVAGKR